MSFPDKFMDDLNPGKLQKQTLTSHHVYLSPLFFKTRNTEWSRSVGN